MLITASILYNYIQCPHKVWRDKYGPQEERVKETNPFVELLWERGVQHEKEVVKEIGDFVDLKDGIVEERLEKTAAEMTKGTPLIYQGVLKYKDLMGIPDLMRKLPNGSYIPIDIKSGMAFEGADEELGEEGKPKAHYAVQLCLYNELLRRLNHADHHNGIIIDKNKKEFTYDLLTPKNTRDAKTWWDFYEEIKNKAELLLRNEDQNLPAKSGVCKICEWYDSCKKWREANGDLTNLFYVGRRTRDRLTDDLFVKRVEDITNLNVDELLEKKKRDKSKLFLKDVGEIILSNAVRRARVYAIDKEPVAYKKLEFPKVVRELFFDIEDDPTQEFVYLHGIYERAGKSERYINFTARENTDADEKKAWCQFWEYIDSISNQSYSVYYYSAHEKSKYRQLRQKYKDVVTEEKLEAFFSDPNVIDLYNAVVLKHTDWPLSSYSLKEIASYLGFKWRDETPSGALSIQWFNEYLEKKDPKMLERILLYNEDDCKATMVIKDGIEKLKVAGYF